jgi:hypothetical protein
MGESFCMFDQRVGERAGLRGGETMTQSVGCEQVNAAICAQACDDKSVWPGAAYFGAVAAALGAVAQLSTGGGDVLEDVAGVHECFPLFGGSVWRDFASIITSALLFGKRKTDWPALAQLWRGLGGVREKDGPSRRIVNSF